MSKLDTSETIESICADFAKLSKDNLELKFLEDLSLVQLWALFGCLAHHEKKCMILRFDGHHCCLCFDKVTDVPFEIKEEKVFDPIGKHVGFYATKDDLSKAISGK